MKVTCNSNKCKEKFEIKLLTKKKEELIQVYFICPFCKHAYHAYYETEQSMRLQEDINSLQKIINSTSQSLETWQREKMLKNLNNLKIRKKKILEGINKKNPK